MMFDMQRGETIWWSITLALSAAIAIAYCVIAVNWYFQKKLSTHADARATLTRLVGLCLSCALCGSTFYVTHMPWAAWRLYDAILLVVAWRAWTFVIHMRGLGLLDQRLAEVQELERSAQKYRQIAELLPHMVWTATADGQVDFSNQRWREYTGDERTWLQAIHPQERQQTLGLWNEAIATRQPVTLEVRLRGRDQFRTYVVKATPITEGDAVKWLGACADVEDQKQLAAEKELQAKQKSFFLNALSHDLRAPLHNVLLNAHLLKMAPPQGAAPQQHDHDVAETVEVIMENAVAAGDLVTKLLDFARVGAHENNVTEAVSIRATVQQIVRRFAPIAAQKGLYLRAGGASVAEAIVFADRQKIERILSNLVDNAIKYTTEGGIVIDVALRSDSSGGSEAAISVSDSGLGVPPESVRFLFDEFYQVNNHERDRSKGFGMGLAICRCLARQLGGDVRLAQTSSAGSCFELVLSNVRADRGGRPDGEKRDPLDPHEARVCGV